MGRGVVPAGVVEVAHPALRYNGEVVSGLSYADRSYSLGALEQDDVAVGDVVMGL